MYKRVYFSILLTVLVGGCSSADVAIKEESPGLAARATIDGATARQTALNQVPGGAVEEAVLEEEDGRLIYSFDIEVAGRSGIQEVLIDAKTGSVLSSTHEDEAAEAAEVAEESEEAERGRAAASGEVATEAESPELRAQATVPDAEARRIALARVPGGRIVGVELEEEDGRLIYSITISVEGHEGIEEVNVDARSGEVVAQEHESGD